MISGREYFVEMSFHSVIIAHFFSVKKRNPKDIKNMDFV